MKKLLVLFTFLLPLFIEAQVVAIIRLDDGTFIVNAPSGRDWTEYDVISGAFNLFDNPREIIDDSETDKIKYFGNWHISDTLFIPDKDDGGNCYCSWSQSANDSLVFRFTNSTWFGWYGELMKHQGIADVYWQNEYITTVDTYGPDDERLTLNWFKDDLDTGTVYTFKLIATGEKNALSTGTSVVNQYFKLVVPDVVEPPIEPPDTIPPADPNNPVTLANGIIALASTYQDNTDIIYPPANSMDGDFDSRWSAEGDGQWLQYELPEFQELESIEIAVAWGNVRTYYFDLLFGNDGVSWDQSLLDQQTDPANELGYTRIGLSNWGAKFLRIVGHSNSVNLWNNYTEVRINLKVTIPPDTIPPPIDPPDTIPPIDPPIDPPDTVIQVVTFKLIPLGVYVVNTDGNLSVHFGTYEEAITHAMEVKKNNPDAGVWVQNILTKVEIRDP